MLDESIVHFAGMANEFGSPNEHAGISSIFSLFRSSRYKDLVKNGWSRVMPTWSAEEQADLFNSPQSESNYSKEVVQRAYINTIFFGGAIRNNNQAGVTGNDPSGIIEEAILIKGQAVCDRSFKAGFNGTEEFVPDVLVHRNPRRTNDGYDFHDVPCACPFAPPFVLRRLLKLRDTMLVTDAGNKYSAGTFHGRDDGNTFEFLCLREFKISGAELGALPLTAGA